MFNRPYYSIIFRTFLKYLTDNYIINFKIINNKEEKKTKATEEIKIKIN